MDVLIAPVYASFLEERDECLGNGGFVVGPVGDFTAEHLFVGAVERGQRDPGQPGRFAFAPMLPCVIYESHSSIGDGGFRYVGLVDEIETHDRRQKYRCERMKPGRGEHGEKAEFEKLPAFVRMRRLEPLENLVPGLTKLAPGCLGLRSPVLRRFMFATLRHDALESALASWVAATPSVE